MNRIQILVHTLILSLVIALPASSQKMLTVEDVSGRPALAPRTLPGLQWAPDGRSVTFLDRNTGNGRASVVGIDAGSGKRRVLIDSRTVLALKNDRVEKRFTLSNFIWSPDGKQILIPSESDLFLFDLKSRKVVQITGDSSEKRDPLFSPDGRKLAYLKKSALCVLDLVSGVEIRVAEPGNGNILVGRFDWVYEEEFGIRTGFSWSPDSRWLAYFELDVSAEPLFPIVDFIPVQNTVASLRYPKAGDPNASIRIHVVAASGGLAVRIDIGENLDIYVPRLLWLPDSRRLAVQRLNRDQNRLDLLLADATTGQSRTVLTEKDPAGWVDANDDLTCLADNRRFVWSSERLNWKHLFLADWEKGILSPITKGSWNVDRMLGIDEKESAVYFTATEKSPLERHLYRIRIDGSGFKRLTQEDGIHRITLSPDRRFFVDEFSNTALPPRTVLGNRDGKVLHVLESGDIPALAEYRLAIPEFLTITTQDGLRLNAFLMKPADFDSKRKYPVLVYTYPGPGSQVVLNDWKTGKGHLWHQMMLQKGYLVFAVDGRGSGARGNTFLNMVYRNLSLAVADQIKGARYLRTLPFVDPNRIGIWGWSGGGWGTCMAMCLGSDFFKAGVAVAPVTDFRNYDSIWTERYMDQPLDNPTGYDASSPLHCIDKYRAGLLIIHGTSDDNVHLSNTMQLVQGLENARKPFRLLVYPGKMHGIEGPDTRYHLYETMTDFFINQL